jgi:crotonobetainyl-CoA:carnitine CoA-transferase CaiB-like acyl-CoA transferase
MTDDQSGGPLSGVRIVDLTSVIMGPFATHMLADMGADVIKIERAEGDSFRSYRPYRHAGMSGSFLHLNRNKRSVLINLRGAEDRRLLDDLIATADVFIHSLRPDAIEALGYGYEHVRAIRPDIIYCGTYGFGAEGPYSHKSAYDDLIQAASGLAALRDDDEPVYIPTVLCDKLTGQAAAAAVSAALYHRARTGRGQKIEVPMFETTVEFAFIEHLQGFAFEPPMGDPGFLRVLSRARRPYKTADGYACILPYSDKNWSDFFAFTGRADLAADPRFRSLAERVENIEPLYAAVADEALKHKTAEWVAFCDAATIPCMPVLKLKEMPDDPHLKAVGLFRRAEHPSEGAYKVIRPPVTFSEAPFRLRHHAPRLGEHTEEIRKELSAARASRKDKS